MLRALQRVLLAAVLAALTLPSGARGTIIPGECIEEWQLKNFQPASPTFRQQVRSSAYHARTTVLLFLASW